MSANKNKKKPAGKKKPANTPATPAPKKLNTRTVFKTRPINLDAKDALAAMPVPKVKLGGADSSSLTSFIAPKKTPSQEALELCGYWYGKLKEDMPELAVVVGTMIGLRRAYAVAYREMQDLIERAREAYAKKGEEVPVTLADFATQFAMYLSSKAFSEHDMMRGMLETVLPCLTEAVDRHTEADQKEELDAQLAENEARKTRPVPIGFKHSPAQEDLCLGRDRALVLVGWSSAVRWLLDQACEEVLKAKPGHTILRLMDRAPKPGEQSARLIRLGSSAWDGCTNTDHALDVMVAKFVAQTVNNPIDLVVCDSMGEANTTGFIGRSKAACAGDANKRFRKWCDKIGSALLAAIPLETPELPDFAGPEWEQLKTFAHLRPVQVLDGAAFDKSDHWRLVVGTDASVFDVPKDTLNSYGRVSNLIVPDGVIE